MEEVQEQSEHLEEDENDINLSNITKSTNKYKIIDSDSESEITEPPANKASEEIASKSSEDEEKTGFNSDNEKASQKKKRKKIIKCASDSDEKSDDEVTPHNKSFPDEETAVETIYTTDSKGELVPEDTTSVNVQKSLSSLYDPDSSEEEPEPRKNYIDEDIINETVIQPKVYKPPRKRKKDEEGPKKMTAQEAAKQRVEIQSESQRMVRECNVSLPYHKPKSYTIKEFLQKRSKLASALPLIPKAPPSVAIKMPKDKLEEVSKKLDERIKQVEEFYKSESEDEEEENDTVLVGEIKNWLNVLVDNAMDQVDRKEEDKTTEQANNETENVNKELTEPFSMDYKFSLDDVDEEKSSKRSKVTELLEEKILNIQPKLSGGPDDIIDLETGVTRPNEVKKLVEKFLQHTARKVPHKHKVELELIGVSGKGEIIKETVSMNVDEEEPVTVETPGAKLQRLREELQNQIAQRRSELWKQKQEQGDCLSSEKKLEEKSEEGAEKDILDDEEEEEMEMTESEYEDEEEEEDYVQKPEKPKVKSAFVEDEAEEDEIEDDEDLMEDNEENDDDTNGFEGDGEEETENIEEGKKKVLKRIIKPFTEDSDEEDEPTPHFPVVENNIKDSHDSTASGEDEIIPPNLPRVENTPKRPSTDNKKTDLDFLTPVTYLTGLQNLNSDSKFSKESPIISPFRMPLGPSPSKNSHESSGLQKVLFPEQTQNSQESVDELAKICSGEFPETQLESQAEKMSDEPPSTQDLLNLCTGGFSNTTPLHTVDESADCGKIVLQSNPEEEIKSLDDDHGQIISQLLDEDEMERFKKKFESPVITGSQKYRSFDETEEVNATGLINSDDENEELEIKKKKGQKKIVFSDDEENSEEDDDEDFEEENEEQIDLHDEDDEEEILEKEIEAQESAKYKPTDFLENEAELSESDWDSADEDEKGLDELEFEQGDEETFNENKVRSELERIHMRQVLDEDNREVKLLQELLLEDGEMHGTGRQRQFRWKTLDSAESSEFEKRDDDDIFLDEEENEEQWRKMRHKREMFLKKKTKDSDDVESILSDSQILNIKKKIIVKSSQSIVSQNSTAGNEPEVAEKKPFSLLSKRGSFLSRNDQVLQRLAEYNKVTETVIGNTAKNSRCFLFQTVESTETVSITNNNNKRKAAETTPQAIKKLRLSDLSPVVNKQSQKSGRFKNLFGNW